MPEARLCGFVHGEFARGQQAYFIDFVNRTLRIDIEAADGVDVFIKQIYAVGQCAPHRENIDQPATKTVFAGRHHLGDMGVAGNSALAPQFIGREFAALLEEKCVRGKIINRHQPRECRGDRHNSHVERGPHHFIERGQPFRNQIMMRRKLIVGQRFPVGEYAGFELRREEREFHNKALRCRCVGSNRQQRAH